jgi:hypothetical protein
LRFYRKAPPNASKKLSDSFSRAVYGESAFRACPSSWKTISQAAKPNAIWQRVDVGASHQLELPGLFLFR